MEGMKSSYFKHFIESSLQIRKNQPNNQIKKKTKLKHHHHCLEAGKKLLNYYVGVSLYTYMHIPVL